MIIFVLFNFLCVFFRGIFCVVYFISFNNRVLKRTCLISFMAAFVYQIIFLDMQNSFIYSHMYIKNKIELIYSKNENL